VSYCSAPGCEKKKSDGLRVKNPAFLLLSALDELLHWGLALPEVQSLLLVFKGIFKRKLAFHFSALRSHWQQCLETKSEDWGVRWPNVRLSFATSEMETQSRQSLWNRDNQCPCTMEWVLGFKKGHIWPLNLVFHTQHIVGKS
jgi:hypothetical protein